MPVTNVPIALGFYESVSEPLAMLECVNFYPISVQTQTISKDALFSTPGIKLAVDNSSNPNGSGSSRGMHVFNGNPYIVQGQSLYRVDRTLVAGSYVYSASFIGNILGLGRVVMADNGSQLCIVAPDYANQFNAYIYDGTTLQQISDPDFDGPVSTVRFLDGYFVFAKQDSQKFFISAIRDGLSYNALDFASAESDPDPVVALEVYRNQLVVFGAETMELFQNVGGADFPFVRTGVVEQKGVRAPYSVVEVDGVLFWIGGASAEKPQVLAYGGGRPEAVSNRAIDSLLSSLQSTSVEEITAWDYADSGASFIGFNLPDKTIVYDTTTQLWHTRESTIFGDQFPWRVSDIVDAYGDILVGDAQDGKIGILDFDTLNEYGNVIKRKVVTPPIDASGDRVICSLAELVCETGQYTGIDGSGAPKAAPKVQLSWSDDGGRHFVNTVYQTLGDTGAYNHRVRWYGLGSFQRSRMFKLEITDEIVANFYKFEVHIG